MARLRRSIIALSLFLLLPATASAEQRLTWDPNREPEVTGYFVWYGTAPRAYSTKIDVGNVTSWVPKGLTPGRRYYFAVQAYTATGLISAYSKEAFLDIAIEAPLKVSLGWDMRFPRPAGTLATFTAASTGGKGPIQYRFVIYNHLTGWRIAQDYGSANKFSYYPLPGTNVVQVWARNAGSTADWDAYASSGYFEIIAAKPVIESFKPDVTFPVTEGTPVTFTAHASGGIGPLQYSFVTYHPAQGWKIAREYQTGAGANTFTYTPAAGINVVQVWVRNAGSTADYDAWETSGYFSITENPPPRITSFTSDTTFPAPANTTVTFTATAAGGNGPLQFRYVTFHPSTGWMIAQDYNQQNWFTYQPEVGTNVVQAWVRSVDSNAEFEDWASSNYFTITSPTPPTSVTLSWDLTFPQRSGTEVTFSAAASGGTAPVEYRFVTFNSATGWRIAQDYGPSATFTYTPAPGNNAVQVWARSVGSTADYEVWQTSGYFAIVP